MNIWKLNNNERANGFSHVAEIDYTDLVAAGAAATLALTLATVAAGHLCRNVGYRLVTAFDGGATSGLTAQIGHDLAAGTDDPDGFLTAKELHADATEVLYATGDGALLNQAGGYAFLEAATIEILFTATGGNLDVLTAGKIQVFLDLVDLDKVSRNFEAE